MTWTLVFSPALSGTQEGLVRHVAFLIYGSDETDGLYAYQSGSHTKIMDYTTFSMIAPAPNYFELGGDLYVGGCNGTAPNREYRLWRYDGAPLSWTETEFFGTSTSLQANHGMEQMPIDPTKFVKNMEGNEAAAGAIFQTSTDGDAWANENPSGAMDYAGNERFGWPLYGDDLYWYGQDTLGDEYIFKRGAAVWNASSVQLDPTYNSIKTRPGNYNYRAVYIERSSDGVVFRSPDGGVTAFTQTFGPDGVTNMTASGSTIIFNAGGFDFISADIGAGIQIYYWSTGSNRWLVYDGAPKVGAFFMQGLTLYAGLVHIMYGGEIYRSDVQLSWPEPQFFDKGAITLSAEYSRESEESIWDATWNGGFLYATRRDRAWEEQDVFQLGVATPGEVDLLTRHARVFPIDDDTCYVFGRMVNPGGLSGTYSILYLVNAAVAASVSDWSADNCGALYVSPLDSNDDRQIFAVRNRAGLVPQLYYWDTNDLGATPQVTDLPFPAGTFVGYKGLAVNLEVGRVAVGSFGPNTAMVLEASYPYTSFVDITDDYPLTGTITTVKYPGWDLHG